MTIIQRVSSQDHHRGTSHDHYSIIIIGAVLMTLLSKIIIIEAALMTIIHESPLKIIIWAVLMTIIRQVSSFFSLKEAVSKQQSKQLL